MMIRRRKFQMKPNMSSATTTTSQQEEKPIARVAEQESTPLVEVRMEQPIAFQCSEVQTSSATCSTVVEQERELTELRPVQFSSIDHMINSPPAAAGPILNDFPMSGTPNTLDHQQNSHSALWRQATSEMVEHPRSPNPNSCHQQKDQAEAVEGISDGANAQRQLSARPSLMQKEKLKDKLVDTKKMKMSDLVDWKPKTENTLKKKWNEKRKQMKTMEGGERGTKTEPGMIKAEMGTTSTGATNSMAGPRVKINERGEMVVDEESLVVVKNSENSAWETVHDDLLPKKISSLSFRKHQRRQVWSVLETDLFYEVMAATGTDFGLMHEFIPTRTRAELKKKYNKEERTNPNRINETLRRPAMLDEKLHQRVERMLEEMDER